MTWLTRVPVSVVEAHLVMLGRIRAEEEMSAATAAAVGKGTKPGRWIRRQWARWATSARGGARVSRATPQDLASMGIGLVRRDG